MQRTNAEDRFFNSTRGRVISVLRRQSHTVEELATELGLTPNGVRVHLTSLERDGLIAQGTPRHGIGKPAATYELSPEADRLFPKPYGLVLEQLLSVLAERVPRDVTRDALIEVGHRLAATLPPATGPAEDRIRAAVALLGDLGGLADIVEDQTGGATIIEGQSCPLADAVQGDANTCRLAETLLADVTGMPVHQACDHTSSPRCRFEVETTTIPGGMPGT